jgi:mono/diheme cytochrome c family protein
MKRTRAIVGTSGGFCSVFCMLALTWGALMAGCKRDDMADQPRVKPLRPSALFADGSSARQPPKHTVAIDAPLEPEPESWQSPSTATRFPFRMTRADLLRGQQRFTVYCTPCHGILGDGDGMIPQRGFSRPPSFHTERLRNAPPTYFYNVMTNGIGAMFPYADRVEPEDRWRIAAYIRALQLSQDAPEGGSTQPATSGSAGASTRGGAP